MGANPIINQTARFFMPLLFQSSAAGANPTLYAASLAEPGSYSGPQSLQETRGKVGAGQAQPLRRATSSSRRELWEVSEEKTGLSLEVA